MISTPHPNTYTGQHGRHPTLAPRPTAALAFIAAFTLAATDTTPAADEVVPAPMPVTLAVDGEALLPVIVHPDASDLIRTAATDLVDHLDRITGARFVVETSDHTPGRGLVIGTTDHFPDHGLADPPTLRGDFDGAEAFAIHTSDDRVLLLGAADPGASHAVYVLLEEIGCRWFFPSAAWQVVPDKPTVTVALDLRDRPALLARRIWYGHGLFDQRASDDYETWARRNRMASSLQVRAGHAYETIIANNAGRLQQRPELLALVDGQRRGPQLCLSNPGAQQMVIDHVLDRFDRQPNEHMVSVDPADGGGHCECPDCLAMGSVSNRVFHMANLAARAVDEQHPGRMVGLYAYNEHSEPPDFQLEPNVYIQLTAGFIRGRYSFDQLLDIWPDKATGMGVYEYFSVYLWDWDMPPGGRAADVRDLQQRIRRYAAAGATSLDAESGNNWGLHGRGYHAANRLGWNPELDLDALLADFHQQAFGPAAEPMQTYYDRLDPGNDPQLSRHLLALAWRDLEQAWDLAADRPDVRARLADLITYLHFVHLRWELDRSDDDALRRQTALDLLTHVHRCRHNYMNHWQALRNWHSPRWADEFGEPSWSARQTEQPHPWAVEGPPTDDEIVAMLQAGLDAFQPDEVEQLVFSSDLLPPALGHDVSRATNHLYQGGLRYLLYSRGGEPIELAIAAGTIAHYRDRAEASYTFFDAEGESLAEGTLPLDGEPKPLTLEVREPGLYQFEISDSSAGWRLQAAPGVIATIPLQPGQGFRHGGHMPGGLFFYVPRGTREIVYHWSGLPHLVHGPGGDVVKEVSDRDRFIRVPVPEGADGAIWHFGQIQLGHLWFFNLPNLVAASPDALLLPRDVMEADDIPVHE